MLDLVCNSAKDITKGLLLLTYSLLNLEGSHSFTTEGTSSVSKENLGQPLFGIHDCLSESCKLRIQRSGEPPDIFLSGIDSIEVPQLFVVNVLDLCRTMRINSRMDTTHGCCHFSTCLVEHFQTADSSPVYFHQTAAIVLIVDSGPGEVHVRGHIKHGVALVLLLPEFFLDFPVLTVYIPVEASVVWLRSSTVVVVL